ncbi:hypothetical protein GGS21DRAFT_490009 [Xylaria nigripes]|nr:hypothetical protein GGS21DRAFT_490009 [Xylaria nigripes]
MFAPMMEQHRFPRRSASHGTLRSSFSSHGGPCGGRSPLYPLHKPLRSVNENSVLLHSPGALESMLKTTTETGDIGIFTIKPVPPSPLRDIRPEIGYPYPRPFRSVENMYRQIPAVRSPSRRDTTSEGFSVQGSDSLESGTSTRSPNSTEDQGRRSFSMTTCGSRHLSHHRSTNTLQSQASGGSNLQRPRSPFPYPTRLKRPGVRPASPAVTENGRIDYSRMVEIDRVSYRTVHGHFDHAYSSMARRPHPFGLRADLNRSNPSLAPPGPPPNFHGPPRPPSSVRTQSPASMGSWNHQFRERSDNTSMRTSSLTSVTNMQRRMLPAYRTGQSCATETPPRYYDYTEGFENKPPKLAPSAQSFVPPSLRTIRYHRSMMLRTDDDNLVSGNLRAVFGEGDSAFDCENQTIDEPDVPPVSTAVPDQSECCTETSRGLTPCHRSNSTRSENSTMEIENSESGSKKTRSSDIDLLPSQIGRDSIDTFNPSPDFESRDRLPTYNYATSHANPNPKTQTKSPEKHVQVSGGKAPTIRSEQGVILRDDTHYEVTGRETPDSICSHATNGANEPLSPNQSSGTSIDRDIENGEIHKACAVLVRDTTQRDALSPGNTEGLFSMTLSGSPMPGRQRSLSMAGTKVTSDEMAEESTGQDIQNKKYETGHDQPFRRHKRNHAVLRISTTNLPRDDNEGHPHLTPTWSTVPLMSPKPISPARQLKVKNSIPRLMKALPPLPDALGYDLPSTTIGAPEEDDFAEILVPFDFQGQGENLKINQSQPICLPPMMSRRKIPNRERDAPKFRLKIKTSSCSDTSDPLAHKREQYTDRIMSRSEDLQVAESIDGFGEKLVRSRNINKMKVRGPRRSTFSSSHGSTVRHNPNVEKPRIVTDLTRQKPHDLFNVPPRSEVVFQNRRKPLPKLVYPQATATSITSDSAPSEERVVSSNRTPSTISMSKTEIPSIDRDTLISSIPPHGLVKRLSNLRALWTSSAASGTRARTTHSLRMHRITSNALSSTDFNMKTSMKTSDSMMTDFTQRRLAQRIRARLFRWVRGAKTGVRKRANRKHSRREQEGIEQT